MHGKKLKIWFLEFYESAIDLQIGVFTQDDEKFGSETWLPLTDDNLCHLSSVI